MGPDDALSLRTSRAHTRSRARREERPVLLWLQSRYIPLCPPLTPIRHLETPHRGVLQLKLVLEEVEFWTIPH
uniref:Uncharacterized protein n=1 Tax=Knipowitschia caucasica TaxID=637954 RepID=A0AAV2MNQ6_KNICA